jgi:hypothetical protein
VRSQSAELEFTGPVCNLARLPWHWRLVTDGQSLTVARHAISADMSGNSPSGLLPELRSGLDVLRV